MLTRRRFTTLALGSSALTACGLTMPRPVPEVDARGTIDAHVHFFNGTDVPVLGFLEQVNFIGDHGGAVPPLAKSPLIAFVVGLLADIAVNARDELDRLPPEIPRTPRRVLEQGDEDRLAAYLDSFQQGQTQTQRQAATLRRAAPVDDRGQILAVLQDAAGVGPADGDAPTAVLRRGATPTARETARGLMDPAAQGGDPQRLAVAGLVRWAIMLTRPRSEIMAQALSLYGRPKEARVFCNAMIDMTHWLVAKERNQSDPDQQIELMSALARREPQVLILNLAPFCPLRAAVEGIDKTLGRVQRAVTQQGFAGVKLYPPMGFRPDDNSAIDLSHSRWPGADRGRMDQALQALYAWCAVQDVPIMAHASPTMGAGRATALLAAPRFWAPVLAAHPDLRVNLAHVAGAASHGAIGLAWQGQFVGMVRDFPNLFFDTGFWTEAAPSDPEYAVELARNRALFAAQPLLAGRMMYGSDWSMIARDPKHPAYLQDKQLFVRALTGEDRTAEQAIMGGNARRWLGVDRHGRQWARLAAFFGNHPGWAGVAPP